MVSKSSGCSLCNFALSAILSVAYFVYPRQWTKILPILFNASLCHSDKYGSAIAYGLAFSSLGDIALEMETSKDMYFLVGLVFFLIGHLFYVKGMYVTIVQGYLFNCYV